MAYVYSHTRKDNGKCFYLGKGKGNRAYSSYSRNRHWNFVADKYGYEVKILVDNISDKKALELEQLFIDQIGLENLTNYQPGGSGGFSDEIRAKALSPEARKKAVANTDYKKIGEKVRARLKGKIKADLQATNIKRRQRVKATNTLTGQEYLFDSQMECAKSLGLRQGDVCMVVNGKLKTTKKYKIERI